MDPQGDVAAIWVALFDDLHGQILHDSSLSNEGVDLKGLEFSALPSGLHLVEEDVFFFDHNGLMGQCIFINEKSNASQEGGGRGRRMWTVGVLVHPQPHQFLPSFHHLPFVRQAATSLSSSSEDFTLLNDYFEKHRRSSTTSTTPSGLPQPKSQRLLGSSPLLPALLSNHHPLTALPLLIATFGPSITTLYKFSLAGARILFYTRPPLKTSAEFAWCVWALGQREQRKEGDEEGSTFLGSVGLMDLGRLAEFGKEKRGWVGCTTDAILKERPHLYDLLIDLSSPLPYPPISLSPPSPTSSSSSKSTPPRQITYSSSSLPLYNECLAILDPSSSSSSSFSSSLQATHSHDCSSSHHSHDPQGSVPGWRGVVDVCLGACEWCLGMVLGRVVGVVTGGEGRVRLPSTEAEEGDETRPQPYEEESASSIGGDEEESSSLEGDDDDESVKRIPSTSTPTTADPNATQLQNDGSPTNDFNTPLSLLHLFTHSTTTLSRSIDHLVHKRTRQQLKLKPSPPSSNSSNASIDIVLGARDLLKLGLGVGSDGGDARLLEKLANHPSSLQHSSGGVGVEGSGSKKGGSKKKSKSKKSCRAGAVGDRKVNVRVEVGKWWSWVPGLA